MDVVDEKLNGGPPMEIIDDVVSVHDRQSHIFTDNNSHFDIASR